MLYHYMTDDMYTYMATVEIIQCGFTQAHYNYLFFKRVALSKDLNKHDHKLTFHGLSQHKAADQ